MAEKKGEEPEKKEEKKPEEKEEKEETELPIVEYGVNFGGLFKGLGEFINSTMELAKKAEELQETGQVKPFSSLRSKNVCENPPLAVLKQCYNLRTNWNDEPH